MVWLTISLTDLNCVVYDLKVLYDKYNLIVP